MKKERNTCELSKERIWKRICIGGYSGLSNSPAKDNSIEKLEEFITKIKKKSAEFEDVVVVFDYDEGDDNNLGRGYMSIYGYRIETDKEYSE